MATSDTVFDSDAFQVILWTFLGFDHVARSRFCVAWNRHNPRVAADTPTVTVMDGRGGLLQEPYSRFRLRAFAR